MCFFVGHKLQSLENITLENKADWLICCIFSQIKLGLENESVLADFFPPAAPELSLRSTYLFVSTVKAALVGSAE